MRAPFLAFPVPAPMAAPLPAPTAAPVTVPQPVVTIASKVNPASIRMTRVFIIGFSSYFRLSPILLLALDVISLIWPVSWTLRASLRARGYVWVNSKLQANRLETLPRYSTAQQILCHMSDTGLRAIARVAINWLPLQPFMRLLYAV